MCEICREPDCLVGCPNYSFRNDPRVTGCCEECGGALYEYGRRRCEECEQREDEVYDDGIE